MTLRIVIAGAGRFGALHARVWQEAGAEVAGVVDIDKASAEQFARRYAGPHAASGDELGQVLDAVRPDALVITSNEDSHEQLALAGLARGVHVFVEKPFAMSSAGARRIQAGADANGLKVVAGHISRFTPSIRRATGLVSCGAIGDLWAMRLRRDFSREWFLSFGDRVHPVWESAIHDIDLALAFADSPARRVYAISSAAAGSAAPSVVSALVEFESGVSATIETAWTLPGSAPENSFGALPLVGTITAETELHGSEGVTRVRYPDQGFSVWNTQGSYAPNVELWPELDEQVGGAMRAQIDYARDYFSGRVAEERVPVRQVVWGIELAEAVVRSLQNGAPVEMFDSTSDEVKRQ